MKEKKNNKGAPVQAKPKAQAAPKPKMPTKKAAPKIAKGESVQKEIDTGFEWYDKNNVDSAVIKELLYD